jgi:hypothetical protein
MLPFASHISSLIVPNFGTGLKTGSKRADGARRMESVESYQLFTVCVESINFMQGMRIQ